ncbi:MAG: hypothetical protein WA063_05425 [Minisyncoccia bacterium]
MDLTFLLRIISAQPDENIKLKDLETDHTTLFTKIGLGALLNIAKGKGLIVWDTVNIAATSTCIVALTKKGREYISLVK